MVYWLKWYLICCTEFQALLGPPDNMREHVVAAAKAMKMGDHSTCLQYIINDKMINKVRLNS